MDSELAIRVFEPTAISSEELQATVWLTGGCPPFRLDPQPPPGVELETTGTGRTWCVRIRGSAPDSIRLVARDQGGARVEMRLPLVPPLLRA